jgi:hexosaminidase
LRSFEPDRGGKTLNVALIPKPASFKKLKGTFALGPASRIVLKPLEELSPLGIFLSEVLQPATGFKLPLVRGGQAKSGDLVLELTGPGLGKEGYRLEVGSAARLAATTSTGLFRGIQTLRQLFPASVENRRLVHGQVWEAPACLIQDRPRYGWRGLMLDCSRHFLPLDSLKRAIELMALHKMNVLHLHLTDDQGWRLEIKKYPLLTTKGAWRGKPAYGGFYTQEEMKDLVAYAAAHCVTVVPEIEMPGHASAALACFPGLSCQGKPSAVPTTFGIKKEVFCAGNDKVLAFLTDVLTEVASIFPSSHIHIGGDECPKDRWKACPKCQARIRREGLRDEDELQSWLIRQVEGKVQALGRQIIGWDEICEGGLSGESIVHWWKSRPHALLASGQGHQVIASPQDQTYLDHTNRDIPWEKVLAFRPTPKEASPAQEAFFTGGECPLWTEHCSEYEMDRQTYPRLCAFSEALWSAPAKISAVEFGSRMESHLSRLKTLRVDFYDPGQVIGRWKLAKGSRQSMTFRADVGPVMREGGAMHVRVLAEEGKDVFLVGIDLKENGKIVQKQRFSMSPGYWTPGKRANLEALLNLPFRNYEARYQVELVLMSLDRQGGQGTFCAREVGLKAKTLKGIDRDA